MARRKKKTIHVNQHNIRRNAKHGENLPVITCKTYDSNTTGHELVIHDANGKEAARIIYRPDQPLACGARVWIETWNDVTVR